jgi:hypothetical protein
MRHLQPIRGIDTAGNRKVRDPHDWRIDRASIFGEGQAAEDSFSEMALRPSLHAFNTAQQREKAEVLGFATTQEPKDYDLSHNLRKYRGAIHIILPRV